MDRLTRGFWLAGPGWALVPLLILCACKSKESDRDSDGSSTGIVSSFSALISPARDLDILFVVDNSPSMDPKQAALTRAFPKMMDMLRALPTGPADVRIGVVSSDMGAGSGEGGGGAKWVLGDRGILWGNDASVDSYGPYATVKDIRDSSGNLGCGMDAGARWIEDIQSSDGSGRSQNYKGEIADVFSCLATAVGTDGCGFEHPLQSLRVALNPMDNINPQNIGFLRRSARLAIVLVSDEDDCSADPDNGDNDGMFVPRTLGDTVSLRCAARGHVCGGRGIPDYDPQTGYTGQQPFVAKFSDCEAKDDTDKHSLPLIRVRDMIDSVSQAKPRPDIQISAFGIIGWPAGDPAEAEYRIDKDATATMVEQRSLWDYLPICQRPDVKSADGNIYRAYGGLRLKKFLDAFKGDEATNLYSICNPDFSAAMSGIGKTLAGMLSPPLKCTPLALADADPDLEGIQADCQATMALSCNTPGQGDCRTSGYIETPVTQCRDGQGHPLDMMEPLTDTVGASARPCWYLQHDRGESGCGDDPTSLRPKILTPGGGSVAAGTILHMECLTCPDGRPGCSIDD